MIKRLVKRIKQMISKCDCGGDLPFFPTYIDNHDVGVYVCKKCKKEWCFF